MRMGLFALGSEWELSEIMRRDEDGRNNEEQNAYQF
jgi:hypothetical protein